MIDQGHYHRASRNGNRPETPKKAHQSTIERLHFDLSPVVIKTIVVALSFKPESVIVATDPTLNIPTEGIGTVVVPVFQLVEK